MARKPSEIIAQNITETARQIEALDRAISEHTRSKTALLALMTDLTDAKTTSITAEKD